MASHPSWRDNYLEDMKGKNRGLMSLTQSSVVHLQGDLLIT